MKTCFIINAKAASGRALRKWSKIEPTLALKGKRDVIICSEWQSIKHKARAALEQGADQIVAVGGDGTVGQVANAFFEDSENIFPDRTFAVVPAGTGCDYFRSLSFGQSAAQVFGKGQAQPTDVFFILIDGNAVVGLNTISIGLTADIIARKERLSTAIPNFLSYLIPTVLSIIRWQSQFLSVNLDEKLVRKVLLTLIMTKGRYGGGAMKLGDENQLNSGNFGVSLVPPIGFLAFLRHVLQLYRQGLRAVPFVESETAEIVEIDLCPYRLIEIDGEIYPFKRAKIQILKSALRVLRL